jgi:hypothetical protein
LNLRCKWKHALHDGILVPSKIIGGAVAGLTCWNFPRPASSNYFKYSPIGGDMMKIGPSQDLNQPICQLYRAVQSRR